jgi:3-methyladenine DNA glycosylase AlkD
MGSAWADEAARRIAEAFRAHADPAAAPGMGKYMRERFPFLGIKTPLRRKLEREALAGLGAPDEDGLAAFAKGLWDMAEREFQYAGCDTLARHQRRLTLASLPLLETLITSKSWWDTVDALAARVAGPIVLRHPAAAAWMDRWLEHENLWLRRSALLHQLTYRAQTDEDRLFRYCLARAGEREFFIRKAIGWALRQYSWTDPGAVRAFVAAHEAELPALSRREALLAINGGRRARRKEAERGSATAC